MKTILKFLIIFAPFLLAVLLFSHDYEVQTEQFLTITIQLVWGILFALGGAIIYLSRLTYGKTSKHIWRKEVSNFIRSISFPIVIQTLIFIFISISYPARTFFKIKFGMTDETFVSARIAADSILISLIVVPSTASILVGMWCIYMAIYHEDISQ